VTLIHERQQQSNWCWIACFRMACSFFGRTAPAQCAIAGSVLGLSGCCPPGSNLQCDRTIDTGRIPNLFTSASLKAAVAPVSDVSFQQILGIGCLVLALIAYPAAFHFIILSATANGVYSINDPEYDGPFQGAYSELRNYPSGTLFSAWALST
jgi:hypothetical protein